MVKTFSGEDIISFVKNSTEHTVKKSFDFITQKLKKDQEQGDDDLIVDNKVDFNLKCPISYRRMITPVRGSF